MKAWLRRLAVPIFFIGLTVVGFRIIGGGPTSSFVIPEMEASTVPVPKSVNVMVQGLYTRMLQNWHREGYRPATGNTVPIVASKPSSFSTGLVPESYEGETSVIRMKEVQSWVEYTFDVASTGLYELEMKYIPLEGGFSPVQIAVELDGAAPFKEAEYITLERVFHDDGPPKKNERGDQIRPRQVEQREWRSARLFDGKMGYGRPLQWLLKGGKHTLRVRLISERMALKSAAFVPPEAAAPYKPPEKTGGKEWRLTLEAESMSAKSDPSIQSKPSYDDLAVPRSEGRVILNTLGGDRWQRGGQWAEWTFEIPEDGWYDFHMKYLQNMNADIISYRIITIDGLLPYEEWQSVAFPYSRDWNLRTVGDSQGVPYSVHLAKGKHVLRMTVQTAETAEIRAGLAALQTELQQIAKDVRMVSGIYDKYMVDTNRDWNIAANMPDLKEKLGVLCKLLYDEIKEIERKFGGENGSAGLRSSLYDLMDMAKDPNVIPKEPGKLGTVQDAISSYIDVLAYQPLSLDQIYITSAGLKPEEKLPGRMQKIGNDLANLFRTFSPNYVYNGRSDNNAITVWVNRSRDYVSQLQQLADESFTPETGVAVNINLMPNEQLLILSNASGREPDVALGLSQNTPGDLAMRHLLVDLSSFPDYGEAAAQFNPGSLLPFTYNGGVYGLPETIMFQMMFYRKDVLESLGVAPPDTWKDVVDLLPSLQQRGMEFYYAPLNYFPIFLQNGVSMYSDNGLRSGLDTPEGFRAFKIWTDWFNVYGFPKEVPNFYMHFRDGSMPIGISDFNTYLQLQVAAPELNGLWDIAPLPGVPDDANGEVKRWAGGALQSGVILKSSKRRQDAWKFLKWWLSEDTQTRFGTDIELANGTDFRWNTANFAAFQRLPWPEADKKALSRQWRWFQEIPNVPGGYYTGREMIFAWNRTVLGHVNPRESLERSVFEINRELERKQKEFGFVDETGNIRNRLTVPKWDTPWRGEDRGG